MIAASQPQISLLSLHSFTLFEKSQKSANFTSLVFNHFPTLFHSCRNKSFVCTLLTKVPQGGTPCPPSRPHLYLHFRPKMERRPSERSRLSVPLPHLPPLPPLPRGCVFSIGSLVYQLS